MGEPGVFAVLLVTSSGQEVVKIVLRIDQEREPDRAKRACESHLARAKRTMENGFPPLLRGGASH
jgi:hypothetical protein